MKTTRTRRRSAEEAAPGPSSASVSGRPETSAKGRPGRASRASTRLDDGCSPSTTVSDYSASHVDAGGAAPPTSGRNTPGSADIAGAAGAPPAATAPPAGTGTAKTKKAHNSEREVGARSYAFQSGDMGLIASLLHFFGLVCIIVAGKLRDAARSARGSLLSIVVGADSFGTRRLLSGGGYVNVDGDGHVALLSDFDSFYTRRFYKRIEVGQMVGFCRSLRRPRRLARHPLTSCLPSPHFPTTPSPRSR